MRAGGEPAGSGDGRERRVTPHLTLRRPTDADLPALVAIDVDPANYEHSPTGAWSRADAIAHSGRYLDDWARDGIGYWVVEHERQVIGVAGVKRMRFARRDCFNLYYRFVAAARGRGLAAETCREALVVAAQVDPSRPVVVRTRPDNAPARRLAEAIGLQRRPELDGRDGFVVYRSASAMSPGAAPPDTG